MILLHDKNVELSRNILATMPESCSVIEGTGGYYLSAYPSVVVNIPVYSEDRPQFGPDGEFLGMVRENVEAHEEILRMPASWDAVASFAAACEERALRNPPVL